MRCICGDLGVTQVPVLGNSARCISCAEEFWGGVLRENSLRAIEVAEEIAHKRRAYRHHNVTRAQLYDAWDRSDKTVPGLANVLDLHVSSVWRKMRLLKITIWELRAMNKQRVA
jgi:hypothetical protein